MSANEVSSLVATLGFPIVMCLALFWYMIKQNEQHEAESKAICQAVNELKVAIVTLVTKLDDKE